MGQERPARLAEVLGWLKLGAAVWGRHGPRAWAGRSSEPQAQALASVSGTSSVASKYEELECLYAAVGKVIYEGLTNYEKATNANPSQLFGECAPGWVSQPWLSVALLHLCSLEVLS